MKCDSWNFLYNFRNSGAPCLIIMVTEIIEVEIQNTQAYVYNLNELEKSLFIYWIYYFPFIRKPANNNQFSKSTRTKYIALIFFFSRFIPTSFERFWYFLDVLSRTLKKVKICIELNTFLSRYWSFDLLSPFFLGFLWKCVQEIEICDLYNMWEIFTENDDMFVLSKMKLYTNKVSFLLYKAFVIKNFQMPCHIITPKRRRYILFIYEYIL